MNEDDIGKVFLFAVQWDWTWIGRFKGYRGALLLLDEAGYFTRTGATFDVLCKEGLQENTEFHMVGTARISANINVLIPWQPAWPPDGGARRRRR